VYLLDTNTCIYYLNGSHEELTRRVLAAGPDQLAISALTVAELRFGAARSSKPEANRERLVAFCQELTILPFDRLCGEHFGRLKAELFGKGRPIPDFDVGIAATAIVSRRTLVSADAHMGEIDELLRENWAVRHPPDDLPPEP
jgi:tRNA(fMet)-specific endonuclease VapC